MTEDIQYIVKNAKEIYIRLLFPNGPVCPICGCKEYYSLADGRYKCKHCKKIFSLKSNTIAHNSKIPVEKWLIALYLMLSSNGISAIQLASKIGVTNKTGWFILQRLRYIFKLDDVVLDKEVAFDETWVGGTWRCFSLSKKQELLSKYKLPHKAKSVAEKIAIANRVNYLYKTGVFGLNDGEKMVMRVIPKTLYQEDIVKIFNEHTLDKGMAVSDCSGLYKDWEFLTGYELHQNNHSAGQFLADNGSSSNRIEGAFSWLKRSTLFNYVHVSEKYLQLYLNERCFRFNHRNESILDRIEAAFKKWSRICNRAILRQFNSLSDYSYREVEIFDPRAFFKEFMFIDKVERYSITYYRDEWV